MKKYFGTDGVRGVANKELTPTLAFMLGRAFATILKTEGGKPKVIIGKDTRISCGMLESALAAGFCTVGVDVISVGVIPTPAIAYLTAAKDYAGGVMISASHNPAPDNGIKFFGPNGAKLPKEMQDKIEGILFNDDEYFPQPTGGDVGSVTYHPEASLDYARYLESTAKINLKGMKIVLDCANGSTSELAPKIFSELGAEIITLANKPNGLNINDNCGSTHMQSLQEKVKECKANLGLAFDGDGDRVLSVDHQGNLIDGDYLMMILANYYKQKGELKHDQLVVTVMSNLGLHKAAKQLGIKTFQTPLGDRFVLEEMLKSDSVLGGEQSGHIIIRKYGTSGDGILVGLQLLSILTSTNTSLAEQAKIMEKFPQLLVNITVQDKHKLDHPDINAVIQEVEQSLKDRGRLLVRPSGTEPLIRIMAEGPDKDELDQLTDKIATVVHRVMA